MKIFNWLRSLFGKTVCEDKEAEKQNEHLFSRLLKQGDTYSITKKTPYCCDGTLKLQTIEKVFDFAYSMTFSAEGEHRSTRSGGSHGRRNGEIFANTFQGKIAECAACNAVYKHDNSVNPDFSISPLGEWDTVDISACGKEIAVKSTKHFGQLLLLETKDWDSEGRYIPNKNKAVSAYDCLLLIRINPSCEDLLRQNRLLYSDSVRREDLYKVVSGQTWSYNYVGFITKNDLKHIIRCRQILPKGALLNGSTVMDAENYYVQAGDMRPIKELEHILLEGR